MFRNLLKNAGITQTELAKKIGKSQRLISAWCHGKCEPQMDVLFQLSDALGVSVEEIVKCFGGVR